MMPLRLVELVTGPAFPGGMPALVTMRASPDSAATGLLVSWVLSLVAAGTVAVAMLTTWRGRLDPLPSPAAPSRLCVAGPWAVPLAGGAVAEVPLTAWLRALAAAGTTVVTLAGPDGFGWPDCAAAGWAGAAAP